MTIRVLTADDQEIIRLPLRMLIDREPDMRVVAEAADGRAAVDLAFEHRPDVVVMDVRMPGLTGVEATELIRRDWPHAQPPPRILVLTTFDLDEYVHAALRSGAEGFLLKNTMPARFIDAIRTVHAGEAVLGPTVTRRLVETFTRTPLRTANAGLDALTARERDVLVLVAEGLSNAAIAGRLGVTESTVKSRVNRVMGRLGVANRVQAAIMARSAGRTS